jgi:hypothetical protein
MAVIRIRLEEKKERKKNVWEAQSYPVKLK